MIEQGALQNRRPTQSSGSRDLAACRPARDRLPLGADDGERRPVSPSASPAARRTVRCRWLASPDITAAQVILGLQTSVSRQFDITQEPAVVTVGAIKGGNRENIIPTRSR